MPAGRFELHFNNDWDYRNWTASENFFFSATWFCLPIVSCRLAADQIAKEKDLKIPLGC